MSTRALVVFVDGETEIAVAYQHGDGYPSWLGVKLCEYLKGKDIVNGISSPRDAGSPFNGINDLAIRTLYALKAGHSGPDMPGGLYLYPPRTRDMDEEFVYYVSERDGKPYVKVFDGAKNPLFEGSAAQVLRRCKRETAAALLTLRKGSVTK